MKTASALDGKASMTEFSVGLDYMGQNPQSYGRDDDEDDYD